MREKKGQMDDMARFLWQAHIFPDLVRLLENAYVIAFDCFGEVTMQGYKTAENIEALTRICSAEVLTSGCSREIEDYHYSGHDWKKGKFNCAGWKVSVTLT